jgi:hypothetical protein
MSENMKYTRIDLLDGFLIAKSKTMEFEIEMKASETFMKT